MNELAANRVFQRIIVLSGRKGPGTLEQIYDGERGIMQFYCKMIDLLSWPHIHMAGLWMSRRMDVRLKNIKS